jgi:hypothetical protein
MSQDSGLIRRGLMLLALMTALVVVVLSILFQRPRQALPEEQARTELFATTLFTPMAGYPASLSWVGLYQVGQELPSAPGWEVRYNAAWALARMGSNQLPWRLFHEMLDEKRQMRNFRVSLENGRTVPDEAKARETVLMALRALADWNAKQKELGRTAGKSLDRDAVQVQVEQLATSPVMQIKLQAEKTRVAAAS